jgi:transposase
MGYASMASACQTVKRPSVAYTRPGYTVLLCSDAIKHGKDTYLSALYQRLAVHRGKKRAIITVAHAIMVSVFHMSSRDAPYRELGANYFDERRRHDTVDRLTSRIERLGYRVYLGPLSTAAA